MSQHLRSTRCQQLQAGAPRRPSVPESRRIHVNDGAARRSKFVDRRASALTHRGRKRTSEPMTLVDEFFGREFLTLLGKREKKSGAKSAGAQPPSQRLAALGFTLGPALAKLLDFVASHSTQEVGALEVFPTDDVVPNGSNAL